LREAGLLALTAPKRLGGLEADLPTALKVVSSVARGEPATALVLVMQYLFHASVEGRSGWPEHLKQRVIGEAIRDGALINALRVEPDLGTPARGGLPATVARRTPEGWRINGRKIYSTGSTALTWFVVWARSDDAEPWSAAGWSAPTRPAWSSRRPGITWACGPAPATTSSSRTFWSRWTTPWTRSRSAPRRPIRPVSRPGRRC
jgi:alkylation response protein AidB-like acyl-CoA dehydrogenase